MCPILKYVIGASISDASFCAAELIGQLQEVVLMIIKLLYSSCIYVALIVRQAIKRFDDDVL